MPSNVTGIDEILDRLRQAVVDIRQGVTTALASEASDILDSAKNNYIPIDQGDLRDEGVVIESLSDDTIISHSIAFGTGKSAPYALTVHEVPSEHDPRSWRIHEQRGEEVHFVTGGRKYLEIPLNEAASTMLERLADKVKLG